MTAGRKTRWIRVLAGGFLGLAILILALPIWFPWALRPALAHFGLRFASYERIGYTRFALSDVRSGDPGARWQARRVQGLLPPAWLWRRSAGDSRLFLEVSQWSADVEAGPGSNAPSSNRGSNSAFALAERVRDALPAARAWLPAARLNGGAIRFGSNTVTVAEADWRRGRLTAKFGAPDGSEMITVSGDFTGDPPFEIAAEAKPSGVKGRVKLSRGTDQWQASGELGWEENRAELEAAFDDRQRGWWPAKARLKADRFRVPAGWVRLDGYHDPVGAFTLDWAGSGFHLEASARATPEGTGAALLQPVELSLAARGDSGSVILERLRVTSPALQADLSDPVGLTRSGRLTTKSATLRVALDMAKVPGSALGGRLNGQVMLEPARAGYPTAEFELSGQGLTGPGPGHGPRVDIARATMGGRLHWPFLDLDNAEFELADGSALGGKGRFDFESRRIADGEWHVQGKRVEGGWVRFLSPDPLACEGVQARGRVSGPLQAPRHSGEAVLDQVSAPHLRPCRLAVSWSGEKLDISEFTLRLASGTAELRADGAARAENAPGPCSGQIDLNSLTLTRDAETLWRLERPCQISAGVGGPGSPGGPAAGWRVKVEGLEWSGQGRGLKLDGDVAWPQRGRVTLQAHGLNPADLADYLSDPMAAASVGSLEWAAEWDRGPVTFQVSGTGRFPALEGRDLVAEVKLKGDAQGMAADPVIVSGDGSEILRAQGRVPLTVLPRGAGVELHWEETGPFDFTAATQPNQAFWDLTSRQLGVRLADPRVEARLQGTLQEVQGTLRVEASQVGPGASTNQAKLPPIEKLRLEARFEGDRVRLSELTFQVEEQPVRVSGDLPIRRHFLRDFIATGALPDWRQSRVRVEIADARIEPFARYMPQVLSPQGRLTVALDVVPGGEVKGDLKIAGAATRPMPPVSPIRDIEATVQFAGRRATISKFTGRMAGREVSLAGHFELPESGTPQFDVGLRGDNVPLVYRPGLLLRSDFNVRVVQGDGGPANISGDVTLRDGLYLQDLKALVPGGRSEVPVRPPYFSVAEKPFADWKLDLKVRGEKFLRVRTPYFRGEISSAFQLKGTLGEPQALGEATIASGVVKFPFGTLTVEQGHASLTSDHPYEPQLFATASSRLYGYNVRMELTGTASAPFISFNSTPPLTSEQLLLMLAAGEMPRDDMSVSQGRRAGNFALYLGKDVAGRLLGSEESADRLTVRSGEDVSQEGKSTYYIEYKLSEDWSVVAEYDRFNALNAGLKWRIFSR